MGAAGLGSLEGTDLDIALDMREAKSMAAVSLEGTDQKACGMGSR